jgi:hypothetical protein
MSENGRRGLNLPRQGEASGKADGFFRIRAVFLDLIFFDYWELGIRVIYFFGDRILDLTGLYVSSVLIALRIVW